MIFSGCDGQSHRACYPEHKKSRPPEGAVDDGTAAPITGSKFINISNSITTTSSNDIITGGPTVDSLSGNNGNDTLIGLGDNDTLNGDIGDDVLLGGDGNDILIGWSGADILVGGAGDDSIDGLAVSGVVNDAKIDLAVFSGLSTDYTVTGFGGDGTFTVTDTNLADGDDGTDTLINIERIHFLGDSVTQDLEYVLRGSSAAVEILTGGVNNDTILGQGNIDTLIGLGGDDFLDGGIGDDRLEGGDGNDTLIGWSGADTLVGGAGNGSRASSTVCCASGC